jgi:hypothetical protein
MKVTLDYPDHSLYMKEIIGLVFTMKAAIENLEKECGSENYEISEAASHLLKMLKLLDENIIHDSLKHMN